MLSCLRVALALAMLASFLVGGQASAEPSLYFPETGHSVAGRFLWSYQKLGGLDRFGYPRTEVLNENGREVQYFQRAVMERFPEYDGTAYEVQLRLLGDICTQGRRGERAFAPVAANDASRDARYFPETGHSVSSAFLDRFEKRGGLISFGYPISEAFAERGLTVQYFQRARFELHLDPSGPTVRLGLLGDELIESAWPASDPRLVAAPASPTEIEWATGRISIKGSSGPGRVNAGIAVSLLHGVRLAPGERLNFDDVARSWDGREDPIYLVSRGTSCSGGLVTMRGGGVCYVSTALWRAWMLAGLKTVSRVSHSGLLDDFWAGFDAANTLLVENDSSANLRLVVRQEGDEISVTVLGDRPPGRRATIRGPVALDGQTFVIYQDVEWLDGRVTTSEYRSYYCW